MPEAVELWCHAGEALGGSGAEGPLSEADQGMIEQQVRGPQGVAAEVAALAMTTGRPDDRTRTRVEGTAGDPGSDFHGVLRLVAGHEACARPGRNRNALRSCLYYTTRSPA